ncbi:MAG: SprT-like domain-containing protein [Emergencia sp.]
MNRKKGSREKTAYEKRLAELTAGCLNEMKQIGIRPAGRILDVRENSRAKKRLGSCRKVSEPGSEGYIIEISAALKEKDDKTIKNVLFHELLHTCRGCMNHGARWKALAGAVNRNFGTDIRVTADCRELGLEEENQGTYRYRIRCTACGETFMRMRKSRVTEHPENYRCARCGGTLTVERL